MDVVQYGLRSTCGDSQIFTSVMVQPAISHICMEMALEPIPRIPVPSLHSASHSLNCNGVFELKENIHIVPYTEYPIFTFLIPLNESKRQRANNAHTNHSPTSLLHLLVVDHARCVPRQMPEAVERVVGERKRNSGLRKNLERQRPGGEAGGNDGALEVPADGRRDQVCGAEDVEGSREGDAGDAVEGGAVPGDLRLVDAEMGCDGAVQALLCEDLVAGLAG